MVFRPASIKTHRLIAGRNTNFRGVAIEQVQAGALVGAKIVLDIIAQVPGAEVAVLWCVSEILPADGVALLNARLPRLLQRADILGAQHPGRTRPERPDKGKAGHRGPRLAQINLLDDRVVVVRSVRL